MTRVDVHTAGVFLMKWIKPLAHSQPGSVFLFGVFNSRRIEPIKAMVHGQGGEMIAPCPINRILHSRMIQFENRDVFGLKFLL